jgi:Pyridoxamine 5'-phosphate oxidase
VAPRLEDFRTLFAGPCPAVLTTYRADGSAVTSPVWIRLHDEHFEMVVTAHDGKVKHLRRDPRCLLVVFESVRPFRGVEVRDVAVISDGSDAAVVRRQIACRYLGDDAGERFSAVRAPIPSVVVRLSIANARVWDLAAIVD